MVLLFIYQARACVLVERHKVSFCSAVPNGLNFKNADSYCFRTNSIIVPGEKLVLILGSTHYRVKIENKTRKLVRKYKVLIML